MYLDYVVDIPDVKGKITFRTKGQARYVYYEYSREYDPSKQYTNVKRVTIGKVLPEDENKMRPNENFRKYFPEAEQPEEKMASCLTWQPIPLLQKEYSVLAEELSTLLDERHPKRKIERAKQALYDAYVESERSLDEIIDLIRNADEWI